MDFFLASILSKLCLPTFTDVLSTPSATQLSQGILLAAIALSMEENMPTAVADLLRHMSTTIYVDLYEECGQLTGSSFQDFGH